MWVETFTGLWMTQFERLLKVVRERGGDGPFPGGGQLGESAFGLGEGRGQLLELLSQVVGVRAGLFVLFAEEFQEFGDVHAVSSMSSRQAGVGVVRRRSMPAVEAQ